MKFVRLSLLATVIAATAALAPAAGAAVPQIATNYQSVCALTDTGTVSCAGANSAGQLGIGNFDVKNGFQVSQVTNAAAIALADYTVCVAKTDGTVWCFGENDDYELGQGGTGTTNSNVPVQVQATGGPLSGVVQLSAQDGTFCGLKSDTTVACWGRGDSGQIGDGGTSSLSLASQVWTGTANLSGVKKISAGRFFSCALMLTGSIKCWGADDDGELGNGAGGTSALPVDVLDISNAVDVGTGRDTACALLADGTVKCWGSDADGKLGNGPGSTDDAQTPQTVPGLSGVRQINVGYAGACAQVADGSLKCWGANDDGELLDPTLVSHDAPTTLPVAPGFVAMSQTFEDTLCVLYRGGAAVCWGDDEYGQIGVPATSGNNLLTPTQISPDLVTLAYPGEKTTVSSPAKTKLDKKKKTYTLTTQLQTTPYLYVNPADACTGAVTASSKYSYTTLKKVKGKKKRKKVKKTKTVKKSGVLALSGETCVATLSLKLPVKYLNGKKAKVTFAAAGNASLQPVNATGSFKLPKVKAKKKK